MDTPIPFVLLHIFTVSGKTFTFKNGTINVDNESTLAFDYTAGSNGMPKKGTFIKANMVGHALMQ